MANCFRHVCAGVIMYSSKSAPVPIARHAGIFGSGDFLSKDIAELASTVDRGSCGCSRFAIGAGAVRPAGPGEFPSAVIVVAVFARARYSAMRMVVGVLIERYPVRGMWIAEDVAAASTVMSSIEVTEGSETTHFIADR